MAEEEKKKEGVSVKEIETFAKKHRFEVFYLLLFILASLFTFVFWGATISIFCTGIGAIIGAFLSGKMDMIFNKSFHFFFKQEGATQIILAIVCWILAIFVAPLVFLILGLQGGKSLNEMAKNLSQQR